MFGWGLPLGIGQQGMPRQMCDKMVSDVRCQTEEDAETDALLIYILIEIHVKRCISLTDSRRTA